MLALAAPVEDAAPDPPTTFRRIGDGKPATGWGDAEIDSAVRHGAASFAEDLARVSGSGAVSGIHDRSARIGVSPWHWLADVRLLPQR